jgi:site-specific recombinase XerD
MTTLELAQPATSGQSMASWAAMAYVASYSSAGTRQAYSTQLRLWFSWCRQHALDPLAEVRRPHVELYARDLEARGLAPATVALKLVVITGFYRYCVEEQLLEHSPAVHVRRPKISQESTRLGLDRSELGAFLRTDGPLLARADGSRLDRHAAGRIMRRLARGAGIDKPISPHSLHHAAITAALDAGCSLRDVQDFARHADPRQTRRYDRARGALDRNPTSIVATYLAGATGAR